MSLLRRLDIDMPNVNPNTMVAYGTIFHQVARGLALGWLGLAFGLRGYLDTNMLVSATQNAPARIEIFVHTLDKRAPFSDFFYEWNHEISFIKLLFLLHGKGLLLLLFL